MRGDLSFSTLGHEVGRIVVFVSPQGAASGALRRRTAFSHFVHQRQRGFALGGAGGARQCRGHRKAMPVLCERVSQVGQMGFAALTLLVEPRIWVGRRGVCIVAALLPSKVTATTLIIAAVFANKRGLRGPSADQSAVHREVIVRQQVLGARTIKHLFKQHLRRTPFQQAITVLGERRMIPRLFVQGQADKPAIQHVVAQLLDQLPLATDAEQNLQHQRPQQFLGRNRFAPKRTVELIEVSIHAQEAPIEYLAHSAQRMIDRNILIQPAQGEQLFLHHIRSTHLVTPNRRLHRSSHRHATNNKIQRISTNP